MCSGNSRIFERGVPVFHRKARPRGIGLLHLLLAGHRGWVREEDVPKAEAFGIFSFTTINFKCFFYCS